MTDQAVAEKVFKILLVDDEANILKSLRRLLAAVENYSVITAQSGPEALATLNSEPDVAVIISDQRMPEMSGVAFLQEARQQVPDAIRILLTGYADQEATIAAINQGAVYRYLTKPWDNDLLLNTVADAVHSYHLEMENRRLNALVVRQKEELAEWNRRLKQRVLEQTSRIREKGDQLAESHQRLQDSFNGMIATLAGLIEQRDRRSSGHSRNVAELVAAMAAAQNLAEQQCRQLFSAGLLHDIGKLGMPDALLGKATAELQPAELQEYRDHVIRGQAAMTMVPELNELGELIRHHHERYDGQGFPDGLAGEAIPMGARMISAADLFERQLSRFLEDDALDAALLELDGEWGASLDPALRPVLENAARQVYSHLEVAAEVTEARVSPKRLEPGMQLRHDLYSGTGVLLLKQGTVFDEQSIAAVRRCFMIDPFECEISVLLKRTEQNPRQERTL